MNKNSTINSCLNAKFQAVTLLALVILLPVSIVQEIQSNKMINYNSKYRFGSLIHLPKQSEALVFRVNGASPKLSRQLPGWFFSVGFEPSLRFEGIFKTSPGAAVRWFSKKYGVVNPDIKKAKNLRLPSSTTSKLKKVLSARRNHEAKVIWKILSENNGHIKQICHSIPTNQIVTSKFGKPRRLPSGRYYFHTGVDIRADVGHPIAASAGGKVVLATARGVSGNTVVLDHGGGLFTQYFHLSRIDVNIGDEVKASQLVGLAGATGRVTGPHLHWEVVFNKKKIDPMRFLLLTKQLCGKVASR